MGATLAEMMARRRRSPKGMIRSKESIKLSIMGMMVNRRRAKSNARKAVKRRASRAKKKRAYKVSRSQFVRQLTAD